MATTNHVLNRCITSFLIGACVFDIPVYAQYSGGTGKPNDPYHIATAKDLIFLGKAHEDYDKHFVLTSDIDLDPNLPDGQTYSQALVAPQSSSDGERPNRGRGPQTEGLVFSGVFNGDNHAIRNLVIKGEGTLGIFGAIGDDAKVSNINVEHVLIVNTGWASQVGALVGENRGSVTNGTQREHKGVRLWILGSLVLRAPM